jgi:SAM-dependent methyltransferase
MTFSRTLERLVARGYGLTYDAVVRGFGPHEALLSEVAAFVARPEAGRDGIRRVLDVSCGTGTVAARLAREGHTVVGLDPVDHLVAVARERMRAIPNVSFHHVDVARGPVPASGTYDVLVSMHTLYWHPAHTALLEACRRALRPGGHALFLTYGRPAHVGRTFREIRALDGTRAALHALRWLVPTALFETFRECDHRYLSRDEFHGALVAAGFTVLEARETFLAGISRLAWARAHGEAMREEPSQEGQR